MPGLFDDDEPELVVEFPFETVTMLKPCAGAAVTAQWLAANIPPATYRLLIGALVEQAGAADGVPYRDELRTICEWWNRLADAGHVSHRVRVDTPAKEIVKAWKSFLRDQDVRDNLADLDRVGAEIVASPFCREGWFRLEKLLGGSVNRDGVAIAKKLVEGGYREAGNAARERVVDDIREFLDDE